MALRKRTELIVVHVSATPPNRDIGAKEIDDMHRARGWQGIGYHFVIRRDGRIERGRPENQVGAHVAGWNSVSLGVCLVGGIDASGKAQDNRTPAQKEALQTLLRDLTRKYPEARICGHRDLSPDRDRDGIVAPHEWLKQCPCFDAIPWARSVGLPAADIRGAWEKVGKDGPDARTAWLQKLLSRAGYEFGPIDGVMGPKTRNALMRFQAAAGFPQTGAFDERTVKRLREMADATAIEKTVEIDRPTVPDAVEAEVVQKTGRWGWLTTIFSGGGAGVGMFFGMQWQTVAVIVVAGIVVLAGGLLLRRQIIAAVKDIRRAVEGRA